MVASTGPPEEIWLKHKARIHRWYILEDKTLEETKALMRDIYGFYASTTQYTTKLKAWGFEKYNPSSLYPCIGGSLKRKHIEIDDIESVTVSTPSGERHIPVKKLKKGLRRSNQSKRQASFLDAPSPPGLQVQFRMQNQVLVLDPPPYPFMSFVAELDKKFGWRRAFFNSATRPAASSTVTQSLKAKLLTVTQMPTSLDLSCFSLNHPQNKDPQVVFQAMFLASNSQLCSGKFREWLVDKIDVRILCNMKSWTAKALLPHLLLGAVEADAVTILRAAYNHGANLDCRLSFRWQQTLLQCALKADSVQCAAYLVDAGVDVNTGRHSIGTLDTPLNFASQSKRCVELMPALLARGATPDGNNLLENCIRSGAGCDTIRSLLRAGVSPNMNGALATAAALERCDIMELLISAGACIEPWYDRNKIDPYEAKRCMRSPAIAAAESKSKKALELLICHNVNLNASLLDAFSHQGRESILNDCESDHIYWTKSGEYFHPIQAAIGTGDCDFVKFMVENGASLETRYGTPPLVLAAQRSDLSMMHFLLTSGANVDRTCRRYPALTALGTAAGRGFLPGMQLLLDTGADINFCPQMLGGRSPLQRAAECRRPEAVGLLIASGADINGPPCPVDGVSTLQALIECGELEWIVQALAANANVNASAGAIKSPLLSAIDRGDEDLVSLLIRLGADVSHAVRSARYFHVRTLLYSEEKILPLQAAAKTGELEICKILLKAGAEIEAVLPEDNERTPLAWACWECHDLVAEYLISQGASLYGNSAAHYYTPLRGALERKNMGIVRLLLQKGVDPNSFCGRFDVCSYRHDKDRRSTPLMEACKYGLGETAYSLAKLLLEYGANVNGRPSSVLGTPLQIACFMGNSKLVHLLLSHGANVNAACTIRADDSEDSSTVSLGSNALQAAVETQNMELVDLLLSKEADVHAAGYFTALQMAAYKGDIPIAEKLLRVGARVDQPPAEGSYGRTAIQVAAENGRLEMLSMLLHNYRGTQTMGEICDSAMKFARRDGYDYVVGYLTEYKEQYSQQPRTEAQDVVELDDGGGSEQTIEHVCHDAPRFAQEGGHNNTLGSLAEAEEQRSHHTVYEADGLYEPDDCLDEEQTAAPSWDLPTVFAEEGSHDDTLEGMMEDAERNTQQPIIETQDASELDDWIKWINWEQAT